MREKMKYMKLAVIFCLFACLWLGTSSFAEEVLPKPGQTIDKSNYQTYQKLFPPEFLEAFTTGWGLIDPLSITIREPVANPMPSVFLDASKKNSGKYSLDAEGYLTGGPYEEIVGFPFPDITPDDKDFATKYMWNFDYRYRFDDQYSKFNNIEKRKGSAASKALVEEWEINFQNRMFDPPAPLYKTETGLRDVILIRNLYPPVQKNFMTLLIRYIDQKKPDATYLYLPSMRRVLRGEAGQRSTPVMGSVQAPDDFGGFSGKIPAFNYKLIGEQKTIVLGNAKFGYTQTKDKKYDNLPVESDNWMVKDVYVIDILPKDDKYPQGKKRIYIDKTNYAIYYTFAWDRAATLWKIWLSGVEVAPLGSSGETAPWQKNQLGLDLQLGYGTIMVGDWQNNGNGIKEADVSVSSMRKRAR